MVILNLLAFRVSFSQSPKNIHILPSLHFMQKKVDESLLLLRINYGTIGALAEHSPCHSASSIFGFLFGMSFLRNLFFLLSSRIFNASLSSFLRIYLGEIHEVDLFSGFAGAAKVNSPLTDLGHCFWIIFWNGVRFFLLRSVCGWCCCFCCSWRYRLLRTHDTPPRVACLQFLFNGRTAHRRILIPRMRIA